MTLCLVPYPWFESICGCGRTSKGRSEGIIDGRPGGHRDAGEGSLAYDYGPPEFSDVYAVSLVVANAGIEDFPDP